MDFDSYAPFPFLPSVKPGKYGAVYEIRTYKLKHGGVPNTIAAWRPPSPERIKLSPLVIAMYALDGPPRFTISGHSSASMLALRCVPIPSPRASGHRRVACLADRRDAIDPHRSADGNLTFGEAIMRRIYSLAYMSSAPMAPPDALMLAQELGYQAIGVRLRACAPGGEFSPLIEDPGHAARYRGTHPGYRRAGVRRGDRPPEREFSSRSVRNAFSRQPESSARGDLVAGDDPDERRLDGSAMPRFCDAAAPFSLTAEPRIMPWTTGSRCQECAADRHAMPTGPTARVLVDCASRWPFDHDAGRSRRHPGQPAQLRAAMRCARRSPDYREGLIHTARCARLLPGGRRGFDLVGIVADCRVICRSASRFPMTSDFQSLARRNERDSALAAAERIIVSATARKAQHEQNRPIRAHCTHRRRLRRYRPGRSTTLSRIPARR